MAPPTVVVSFDVGEQVPLGFLAGPVSSVMDEFGFQVMEPDLDRRIVPAIALSAHRQRDADLIPVE